MHIPANCDTLESAPAQQFRIGLQGFPGVGKTWGALTFPNPVVGDIDRGLGAHTGRKDIIQVPFFNPLWCKTIYPSYKGIQDLRDVVWKWINTEGRKLEADQTFVLDGGTGMQNAYHKGYDANPVYTKQGKEDDFAEWRMKIKYFGDLFALIKELSCNFIYITHEFEKPDKMGDSVGKIRPLMTGAFANELNGHFTDWFRSLASSKPKPEKITDIVLKNWGMTRPEFDAMLNTFPRDTIYYWRLESDDTFDGKCSSLIDYPCFIPANYTSFKRYMRK